MSAATTDTEATALDPEDRLRALDHLRSSQRLIPAVVIGALAATVGAVAWALVTVLSNTQIGWLAIGIGALVGVAVRWQGRGFEVRYAVLGAALAFAGVFAGNFLTILGLLCKRDHAPFFEALQNFPFAELPAFMRATFEPMDVLFYALAIWCGWKYSRRELADTELRATLVEMKSGR